jgi:hypothetical protein
MLFHCKQDVTGAPVIASSAWLGHVTVLFVMKDSLYKSLIRNWFFAGRLY